MNVSLIPCYLDMMDFRQRACAMVLLPNATAGPVEARVDRHPDAPCVTVGVDPDVPLGTSSSSTTCFPARVPS